MKLMKGLLSAFAVILATTACAGNSGENKKSNESTKEDNKMEVVALNKADFLKKNRHKAQRKAKFYINKCRSASCMQSRWKRTPA